MLKMRIRDQIIDFIEVSETPSETLYDRLIKVRDDPNTNEDVRLIILFILGGE